MTDAVPLPWHHPTQVALATALGVSVRTLENWRPRGCPVADAPFDELAVRLWVNAEIATGKRMGKLADPSPVLAPYLELAAKARTAKPVVRDTGNGLKRKQEQMLDLKMAERQKLAQRQATDLFLGVLGKLDQLWDREVGSQFAQKLWDLASQQTASQAVPPMQQLLRDTYRAVRRRALA